MIGKTPYEELANAHERLLLEIARVKAELATTKAELTATKTEPATITAAYSKLDSLLPELEAEQNRRRTVERQLADEKNQKTLLLQSTSWRITAPLRACVRLFRR